MANDRGSEPATGRDSTGPAFGPDPLPFNSHSMKEPKRSTGRRASQRILEAHTEVRDARDLTSREALLWALGLAAVEHTVAPDGNKITFADGSTLIWNEKEKKARRPGWVLGPRRTLEKSRAHLVWDRYRQIHKPGARAASDLQAVRWALNAAGQAWGADKHRVYLCDSGPYTDMGAGDIDYEVTEGIHLKDGSTLVWFEDPADYEPARWMSDADLAGRYTLYRSEQEVLDFWLSDPAAWHRAGTGHEFDVVLAFARKWKPQEWPWGILELLLTSIVPEAFDLALEKLGISGIDGVAQASPATRKALAELFADPRVRREITEVPSSREEAELHEARLCRIMRCTLDLPTPGWPRAVIQWMLASEHAEVRGVALACLSNMEDPGTAEPKPPSGVEMWYGKLPYEPE